MGILIFKRNKLNRSLRGRNTESIAERLSEWCDPMKLEGSRFGNEEWVIIALTLDISSAFKTVIILSSFISM